MSSTTLPGRIAAPAASAAGGLRFGRTLPGAGEATVLWLFKRNCSMAPRQLFGFYAVLCLLSLGIAAAFWAQGATLVMPFAWLEVLALGAALLLYGAHAADCEHIRLQDDMLTVEHANGRRTERAAFRRGAVRIEPEHGDGSLIELSGQGQRIMVGRYVRPELRRELADELRRSVRSGRWGAAPRPVCGAV
jgi:uncharacterized membrane protein